MSKDKKAVGLGKSKIAGREPLKMVAFSAQKIPLQEGREPVKMVPQKAAIPPARTGTTAPPPAKPSPAKE